jgi:hypothetical protein
MRGLAAFAMGGRSRAVFLAMASSGSLLFGWFSAALVALVTLRKGYGEGLMLLLWACLPALLLIRVTGDSTVLALILGTTALSVVLRASMSLALTALASAAIALATGVLTLALGGAMLEELVRVFGEFIVTLEAQRQEAGIAPLGMREPTAVLLAGMLGTANGALSFLCLVLARSWQAGLYNPGGFGSEFRALRFPPAVVVGLVAAAAALVATGFDARSWATAMLLPVTIAGFALLHARARHRGQGSFWVGAIYVAWMVFDAAKLALVGLVVADAALDFRRRWGKARAEPGSGADDDRQDDD